MKRWLLLLIAFIEGFASLGIEITALRRLVPHLGSSITITAPTIGLFLVALALGYRSGARFSGDFLARVQRNFLLAALIAGIGLSPWAGQWLFAPGNSVQAGYLLFMLLVVCPAAGLLAQTVPLISNLIEAERAGEASGLVLAASTAGSVGGASLLPLAVMPTLGVSAAGLICSASLVLAVLVVLAAPAATAAATAATVAGNPSSLARRLPVPLGVLAIASAANLASSPLLAETAYADYGVGRVPAARVSTDLTDPLRVFLVNNQWASILDASVPPRPTPYIQRMQRLLSEDLGLNNSEILVLGAGGFTLSLGQTLNRYVYVDVDPKIVDLAEQHFLKQRIVGDFVADDARHFLLAFPHSGRKRFDAIVVDVYSSHASVPAHLTTLEFWRLLPVALADDGVVVINLILDSRLRSPYARNLLETIETALGRCAVEVLNPAAPVASNVLVTCRPAVGDGVLFRPGRPSVYTDERNPTDRDRGLVGY